ncbi:MAG: Uma2 family endonuclease [Isosphaeraceae bacterium]
MTLAPPIAAPETVAELLERLGGIPPGRVRLIPAPGTATEADVLRHREADRRLFELVDGTLVEKAMGYGESRLTVILIQLLANYLDLHDIGIVTGPDGLLMLTTGLIRIPDVSFVSWDRLPDRMPPQGPMPRIPIDLAVEVISLGNTPAEMERKVAEYLDAGTRLIWLIDPRKKAAWVYAPGLPAVELNEGDTLDGGDVLPDFILPLTTLFERASRGPIA